MCTTLVVTLRHLTPHGFSLLEDQIKVKRGELRRRKKKRRMHLNQKCAAIGTAEPL